MVGRTEVVTFDDEHVTGAARLLGERHRSHRAREALLPDVTDFVAQVEGERDGELGAVALTDGVVTGYLLGKRRVDAIGPHIWSYVAGHAVRDPETIRDLYAVAADRWVAAGLSRHFVYAPAVAELIEPWFRLSFGASAALAARSARSLGVTGTGADVHVDVAVDVHVREGVPADLHAAARLDRLMQEHLRRSPSFGGLPVDSEEASLEEWGGTWADERFQHFVAEQNGRIVGQALLYRRPEGDLRVPPNSIELAGAVTEPEVRGSGVGVALTAHVLEWARDHGYETVITDWRMTNLQAARFWPRRGFRETFLRMYRSIP